MKILEHAYTGMIHNPYRFKAGRGFVLKKTNKNQANPPQQKKSPALFLCNWRMALLEGPHRFDRVRVYFLETANGRE